MINLLTAESMKCKKKKSTKMTITISQSSKSFFYLTSDPKLIMYIINDKEKQLIITFKKLKAESDERNT